MLEIAELFSYHSCGKSQLPQMLSNRRTQQWLDDRQMEMLPVPYIHITTTVPVSCERISTTAMHATACEGGPGKR